jgi:hypothetical protein
MEKEHRTQHGGTEVEIRLALIRIEDADEFLITPSILKRLDRLITDQKMSNIGRHRCPPGAHGFSIT